MSLNALPHLETFAEAAERGSFTAAARQLGLTQAAVSQRIQQLEAILRTPLFRREGGRVSLTSAGRTLHGYARRILGLASEAISAVTGRLDVVTGELAVAASSVPGQHLLPPILAAFRRRHPTVHIRVSVSDTDAVLREVEHGHAHLGLVGGRGGSEHLQFRRFACDSLVLIVPPGHEWWRKRSVTPASLLTQPLVQREAGSASRRCLERALDRLGISASGLDTVLELGSNEAVKEAVLAGLGLAVLSRHAVENEVKDGRLRTIRVTGLTLDRDMFIVHDRRRALPTPARLFVDVVQPEPESATAS